MSWGQRSHLGINKRQQLRTVRRKVKRQTDVRLVSRELMSVSMKSVFLLCMSLPVLLSYSVLCHSALYTWGSVHDRTPHVSPLQELRPHTPEHTSTHLNTYLTHFHTPETICPLFNSVTLWLNIRVELLLNSVVLNYFLSCPPERTEIFSRPLNWNTIENLIIFVYWSV